MVVPIIALGVGITAGLLGALCGVGGGIIMVPAFVMALGLSQKSAVASSLAVMIPMAVVATWRYAQSALIDWRIVFFTALGSSIAAYFGTDLMRSLENQTLTRLFGALVTVMGVKMLFFTKG